MCVQVHDGEKLADLVLIQFWLIKCQTLITYLTSIEKPAFLDPYPTNHPSLYVSMVLFD